MKQNSKETIEKLIGTFNSVKPELEQIIKELDSNRGTMTTDELEFIVERLSQAFIDAMDKSSKRLEALLEDEEKM